jgi:hypothetical protein
MNVQLPPFLFYAVGVMLMVFGTLRALLMGVRGRKEADAELAADRAAGEGGEAPDPDDRERATRKAREARRHVVFGIVWVAMGLFLVISTFLNTRR